MEVPAILVEAKDEIYKAAPGSVQFRKDDSGQYARMVFICPCGCGDLCGITLQPAEPHGWSWNQSKEKPTVSPSIKISKGEGEHWHGFLTDGVFRSC